MKAPLFSVIIPAHNEEEYIGQTIDSILAQTEQNFEIIVVNDGSTDKTADIVRTKALNTKKKIRLISYDIGHSAAFARNRGAEEARGTYLLFQDADCFADPTLLNNAAKYLEDYPIDGVATRTTNTAPRSWVQRAVAVQRAVRWENNQSELRPIFLDENSGINVAIMKRSAFKSLGGFSESIFYFEDNDLTQRFFKAGYSAMFGPSVIQYHNDPLTLRESIGQCKSIAKGMKLRLKNGQKLTRDEKINLSTVPVNILTGFPQLFIWFIFTVKTKDIIGAFYFSILWSIRNVVKLYYLITL